MNPFVLSPDQYSRDLNIVKAYVEQNAMLLHKETGEPLNECLAFVQQQIKPGGPRALQNPELLSLEQVSPGNREKVDRTFLGYIKDCVDKDWIISPSMVCYERPEVNKSTSAAFIEGGIKARKAAKKEQFEARQRGDKILEYIKDCEQNAKKIGINSVSGMHGFSGNILYVKSGHSSLTSMCRTATGYGNANNERLITGSRHYWNEDIVTANILAVLTNTDFAQLEKTMNDYAIIHPSVEETMACIEYSTTLYWRNDEAMADIERLVSKLDPLERAAFVYTGDLYHLRKYNDGLIRQFMNRLIDGTVEHVAEPETVIAALDDDTKALVNYLNADVLDTYTDEDGKVQSKTHAWLKENDPEGYMRLARTAVNIKEVLIEYTPFIRTFLVPQILPPTVANIKSIIRRTAIASDTDSTIFTVQDWVLWYTGTYARSRKGDGIWYVMTYLATQCIVHVLAQFSANMGVSKGDLHRLSMKNEYSFPVFSLTSRAKHYFAVMSAREGNVYSEYDNEIKGVALRSSTVPVHVIKRAKELMLEILATADKGEQLSLHYVYGVIWEFENDIKTSIEKGEGRYLKTVQIKDSYKNMETSAYQNYPLWEEIFAPKYGSTPPPPYAAIKVSLEINNKTEMEAWLNAIEDQALSKRLRDWMVAKNRKYLTTLHLPISVMGHSGMPPEILQAVNIKKLIFQTLESFYMLLESLGVYTIDSSQHRLVSDFYTPPTTGAIR